MWKQVSTHATFGTHSTIHVHYTFTSMFGMLLVVVNDSQCIITFSPSQVVTLMSVDLLRQQPRWKEALVSLREMMTSLIQQVHSCKFCSYMNALFIKFALTPLLISIKRGLNPTT